jgi:leucyl aminopeptidase
MPQTDWTVPSPSTPIEITAADLTSIDAPWLAVPFFEDDTPAAIGDLDTASGGAIGRALAAGEVRGRLYDLFMTPVVQPGWRAGRLVLVGAGPREARTPDLARRLATTVALAARQRRETRLTFVLRGLHDAAGAWDGSVAAVEAAAEGVTLADFTIGSYKTGEPAPEPLRQVRFAVPGAPAALVRLMEEAARRGRLLGDCTNLARGLANEPGNTLTPRELAARAARLAGDTGATVEILDERQIEALGMGLLLGVARGSHEPPRLIVMRHEPAGAPADRTLALVGKGVTFDTGGISIKPAENMDRMKDDMSGGAAVICAMRAISALNVPARVIGVVPATENMPGGMAIKPGDILRGASGKTVEVLNTDAEGRLILGDAIWYAQQLGATHLVDVATLTGAIVVALGKLTTGLFGKPDSWVDLIRRCADKAGDRIWPMPLVEEYREQLKSDIADFSNTGGRPAGSITAALFLSEFVEGRPWAHLDIAGTAWSEEARPYQPKGPTGAAVRALVELACASAEWPK